MKPKEPKPLFPTITGGDWKRELEEARKVRNSVKDQIRWLEAQRILTEYVKQQTKRT